MTVNVSHTVILLKTESESLLSAYMTIDRRLLVPAEPGMKIAQLIVKEYRDNIPEHAFQPAFLPESEKIPKYIAEADSDDPCR